MRHLPYRPTLKGKLLLTLSYTNPLLKSSHYMKTIAVYFINDDETTLYLSKKVGTPISLEIKLFV